MLTGFAWSVLAMAVLILLVGGVLLLVLMA
jgi:hypothetical protein